MRFHSLLAKKYIFSQKRHSILTVCSITAALTLMTMLFAGFSTIMSCRRAYEYDTAPYHCIIYPVTEEQCGRLSETEGIASCTFGKNEEIDTDSALILFEKGTKDDVKTLSSAIENAGISLDNVLIEYNPKLMSLDFVGEAARVDFAEYFALFYVFVIFLALAMRLIIDTAFEISSKERERQFGVLQSIGATPRQIVKIITLEGTLLSVIGIPLGLLCGVAVSYGAFRMILSSGIPVVFYSSEEKARQLLEFSVNPWLLLASAVTGYVWVWLSAYATGMRIVKMSPIQAISSRSNKIKKVRKHRIFSILFGWKGTLAARNTGRSPKRFLITVVSLTVSITLFASFSYVLDTIEQSYKKIYESQELNFDISIKYTSESDSPLVYKNGIKLLEDSGYFENIRMKKTGIGSYHFSDDESVSVYIIYCNKAAYNELFGGTGAISYDELASSGEYLMIEHTAETTDSEYWDKIKQVQVLDSLDVSVNKRVAITEQEYAGLSPEEQEQFKENTLNDEETGEQLSVTYHRIEKVPHTYSITDKISINKITDNHGFNDFFSENDINLIATLPQFDEEYELYGDWFFNISTLVYSDIFDCDLAEDELYNEMLEFIGNSENFKIFLDMYIINRDISLSLAFIRIIVGFINAMVVIIALINLVNIISTGLLNRRSELASMQCVGMTERQLYGMTAVECLRYSLTSGILSSILCILLMLATNAFMRLMTLEEELAGFISYTAPLPAVWLGAAVSFVVALITSLISLNRMKKQSLVEQIQSVD